MSQVHFANIIINIISLDKRCNFHFRYVEINLMENLRSRLSRKIAAVLEYAQSSMLDKIGELLSSDQRDFIQLTPHTIPLQISYVLDCTPILSEFTEEIDFNFTLSPYNIYSRTKQLQLRANNFLSRHRKGHQMYNDVNITHEDPTSISSNDLATQIGKIFLSEESTAAANQLVTAAGGMAFTSISEAKEDTATLALSAVMIYSALYVCERAMWTLAAREQEYKSQFVKHARTQLPILEFPLALGIRQQIHRELTTLLGVACGTVESSSNDLKDELSKISDDIESMEEISNMSSVLVESAQDIQYNIDRLNVKIRENAMTLNLT